jgi:hypothetical protein
MIQWKMETQLLLQVELKGVLIVVVSVTASVSAPSWSIGEASNSPSPGRIISGLVVTGEKSDVFVRSFHIFVPCLCYSSRDLYALLNGWDTIERLLSNFMMWNL